MMGKYRACDGHGTRSLDFSQGQEGQGGLWVPGRTSLDVHIGKISRSWAGRGILSKGRKERAEQDLFKEGKENKGKRS